ncbi:MAG: hypothetical protein MUP63_02805 [Candidatus Nanohaloarchaeota archaeon QJJ-7]|nr:hypothetical protein [Candidatus Nanohaloarchaeota archaeon QJJ-7]
MVNEYRVEAEKRGERLDVGLENPLDDGLDQSYTTDATEDVHTQTRVGDVAEIRNR